MKHKHGWQGLLLLGLLTLLSACSRSPQPSLADLGLPEATRQVLLVQSSRWNSTIASLQRMEKTATGWRAVGNSIAVRVGRNGMGWGAGLHADVQGVEKMEGDGKAPAGIFPLGTVFGYAAEAPTGLRMLYRQVGERDYFVDAVDSPDYNHWRSIPLTEANEPKQRWNSFERMRRDDHQYEYGMIVGHNMIGTQAGRGSAIFLHVWLNPATPTSGCTAMSKEDLLTVLKWLNPASNPLLVQVPVDEFARLHVSQGPEKTYPNP